MSEIILDANEKTPVRYSSRTEMVIIAIALVGTFFKIQHWPGANIMIAVGLTSLAIIYFPMGFYFLGNNKQNVVATVSGLFLSLIPVSIMFKHLHWPGALVMVIAAISTAPLVFAGLLYMRKKATPDSLAFYNNMLLRTGLLMLIMFFLALLRMH
jgi:hypothetical protein